MRYLVACLALVPGVALADRYFTVPTGRKLPFESYRIEFAENPYHRGTLEKSMTLGLSKSFEAEIRYQDFATPTPHTTFDLAYNVLGPIPDLAPGISVGMQDISDQTPDGRRAYLAITYRKVFSTFNGDTNGDVTLGTFFGRQAGPFVGMAIPFSQDFRLIFEHDPSRLSAGFEYRIASPLTVRWYLRGDNRLVSVAWTGKY